MIGAETIVLYTVIGAGSLITGLASAFAGIHLHRKRHISRELAGAENSLEDMLLSSNHEHTAVTDTWQAPVPG